MHKKQLIEAINAAKAAVLELVNDGRIDEAKAKKTELKSLQEQLDLIDDLDLDVDKVKDHAHPMGGANDAVQEFAAEIRGGLPSARNVMTEGTAADGGYTVPEDIQTRINKYKDANFSLRRLVTVENVTTNKGARTYQVKSQVSGFQKVAENGKIQPISAPQFERLAYEIEDYAGYIPISGDLLADSDANITNVVVKWIGDNSLATDNNEILDILSAKEPVNFVDASNPLGPLRKAVNVTLGQAYSGSASIVTNDSGLNWLDNLRDTTGRPLVNPSLTEPGKLVVTIGAHVFKLHIVPNNVLANDLSYIKTADTALAAGKTYYTRSGSAGEYTYTEVEEPALANIGTYYEKTGIPIFVGDFKEAIQIFDRQQTRLRSSREASVTGYNAFEQRGMLIAADVRADYKERDAAAYVFGCLPFVS